MHDPSIEGFQNFWTGKHIKAPTRNIPRAQRMTNAAIALATIIMRGTEKSRLYKARIESLMKRIHAVYTKELDHPICPVMSELVLVQIQIAYLPESKLPGSSQESCLYVILSH